YLSLHSCPTRRSPDLVQIIDDLLKVLVADHLLRERRHHAEPVPHLKGDEKLRQRFVVQRRAKAGLAARVATVAVLHVQRPSPRRDRKSTRLNSSHVEN